MTPFVEARSAPLENKVFLCRPLLLDRRIIDPPKQIIVAIGVFEDMSDPEGILLATLPVFLTVRMEKAGRAVLDLLVALPGALAHFVSTAEGIEPEEHHALFTGIAIQCGRIEFPQAGSALQSSDSGRSLPDEFTPVQSRFHLSSAKIPAPPGPSPIRGCNIRGNTRVARPCAVRDHTKV